MACSAARITRTRWPEHAAEIFAGQLAADRVPSVRAVRAQPQVCQPRAQRLRELRVGREAPLRD